LNPSPEQRAGAVLQEIGFTPATRAASGRYQRSLPITPGVRYWATSQPRLRQDFLGIQFFGEGALEGVRFGDRLIKAGFQPRTPQTGQLTFAKAAPYAPSGDIDGNAIRSIRDALDSILKDHGVHQQRGKAGKNASFRNFMLASPLAGIELSLPERPSVWRSADL
jgi:hypothetical protein